MKKCLYCANDIQDAAIKCQYCNEFVGNSPTTADLANSATEADTNNSIEKQRAIKSTHPLMILEVLCVVGLLGIGGVVEIFKGRVGFGIALILSAILSIFVCPLAWRIGDKIRQFAMPSSIFTTEGFSGLVKARLFWMVGPQSVGVAIVCVGLYVASAELNKPNESQPSQVAVQSSNVTTPIENEISSNLTAPSSSVDPPPVQNSTAPPLPVQNTELNSPPSSTTNSIPGSDNQIGPTAYQDAGSPTSFNCDNATGRVDRIICNDHRLAGFDQALSINYKRALSKASPEEIQRIRNDQRTWLIDRNNCADVLCIRNMYLERINALQAESVRMEQNSTAQPD